MPRPLIVPLYAAVLVVLGLGSSPAQATKYWKNSIVNGSWGTGTNWSASSATGADNGGAPVLGEAVNIVSTDGTTRTVTYNVSAPSLGLLSIDLTGAGTGAALLSIAGNTNLAANGILVGGYSGGGLTAGRGAMSQSAGTVSTNPGLDFVAGYGAGSTGTYTLSGTGSLTANQSEYVGLYGNGTFSQSAGTNTVATATGFFDIGTYAGSSGTYNLSDTGTLTVNTNEYVGDIGTGVFNQTGGTHTLNGGTNLYLGNSATGMGTYNLSAGALNSSSGGEIIGQNGSGSFNQTGGINTVQGILTIGDNLNSIGSYSLSSGSLICHHNPSEYVGSSGTGTFTQSGGINSGVNLFLGAVVGATGTYTLSAGEADFAYGVLGGVDISRSGGTGVLNVTGTGVFNGNVYAFNTVGTSVNLSGGTINTSQLNLNGHPEILNWTSGTLDLTTSVAFDPAAVGTTTAAAFGPALTLGADQQLTVSGNEGLGGTGAFSLTLNSGGTHIVGGTLTVTPTGTITQNAGSTLNAATFIQAGGTVNGTLQNQGSFIYQSGQFHGRLLNQGTVSLPPSFTFPDGVENDTTMTVAAGQTLTLNGAGLDNEGTFTLNGGTLAVNNMTGSGSFIFNSGTLTATQAGGTISASIVSNSPTTININADNVSLGNAASFTGFNHQGVLNVGANTVTLNSAGYARLGTLTSLAGGTINAPNGIYISGGGNVVGNGTVNARITGDTGSVIEATGALALGSASSSAGFVYDGELHTKQFAVTLNTSAIAGLGNLTTLGNGATPGTLTATNGFATDFDQSITGYGTINSTNTLAKHATINGTVQGTSAAQPITLSGYIKGTGTFTNVSFTGTFSPGLSPTITSAGNLALASSSTLEMELGGIIAGTAYDEIQATGALALGGTLHVSLINGFVPTAGQAFDILDWGTLSGTFSSISLPTLSGLTWNTSQLYTIGVISVASAGLPGDYNNNGVVDASDYVVWRKNQGTTNGLANDPIGGTIGVAQYNQWRTHFGQTSGSGSGVLPNAAVPEPATLVLLIFAAAGACLRRVRNA